MRHQETPSVDASGEASPESLRGSAQMAEPNGAWSPVPIVHRTVDRTTVHGATDNRTTDYRTTDHRTAEYALRNLHGFWELTFDGRYATVPQDLAMFHLAWLLSHPDAEPLPAQELAEKVIARFGGHPDFRPAFTALRRGEPGFTALWRGEPGFTALWRGKPGFTALWRGKPWLDSHGDGSEVAGLLRHKQQALEAILDSEEELDPVKSEALRELTAVYDLQKRYLGQIAETQHNAGEIVSKGIHRLHDRLAASVDGRGQPHSLLRAFAWHLRHYLLIPSARSSGHDLITRFAYRPPPGVTWNDEGLRH